MLKSFLPLLLFSFLYGCRSHSPAAATAEEKARKFIRVADSATLTFLHEWNYTQRMNYYRVWTRVKQDPELEYSFLYEPAGDTTFIELYDPANFMRDYPVRYSFDTSARQMYRLGMVENTIVSIVPKGAISGNANQLAKPVAADSLFPGWNPFVELKKMDEQYRDKFNFDYCIYMPSKGNYTRFVYSDSEVVYHVPPNLILYGAARDSVPRLLENGKQLEKGWILVNYRQ